MELNKYSHISSVCTPHNEGSGFPSPLYFCDAPNGFSRGVPEAFARAV